MDEEQREQTSEPDIDERWLGEWVDFGMAELEHYLLNYASFQRFIDREGLG